MDQELHRRTVRLPDFDYSQAGAYFVTICAFQHKCVFGEIVNGEVSLSPRGAVVEECWKSIPDHFPTVNLGAFIVMPNHMHGIIHITTIDNACSCRGTACRAPTADNQLNNEKFGQPVSGSIPTIVRSFKSAVTKRVFELSSTPSLPIWQRGYYEHIIRTEHAYTQIEGYILENPLRWGDDPENCG